MKIGIVHNRAVFAKAGTVTDLASDKEMELIPMLAASELSQLGHGVELIPADLELGARCQASMVDVVLNLAEGFGGTNVDEHLVPWLLDQAGVPYTGADVTNMAVLRDKAITKAILAQHGVVVADHHPIFCENDCEQCHLDFPLIVKPIREEASIGIRYSSVVTNKVMLRERARVLLKTYRQPVLAEQYITGREFSVGVWGNKNPDALPVCEFLFTEEDPLKRFRSFEYKWLGEHETMEQPTDLPATVRRRLSDIALLAHDATHCRDYSRADFRYSDEGELYFLEHNFNPGIGPNTHGLSNTFTRMCEFAGYNFVEMLSRLLSIALARYVR
jgi:D-alanine-D-alanine ligase